MRFTSTLSVCQHFRSEHKLPTTTGFTDLPNELMSELWSKVLDPEAVQNFAVTSKSWVAVSSKSTTSCALDRYSFIHHRQDRVGSSLVEILKALLHNIWGGSEGKEEWVGNARDAHVPICCTCMYVSIESRTITRAPNLGATLYGSPGRWYA